MRIAIVSSGQGFPEESSPGDALDTRRIGKALAGILAEMYPAHQVNLLNRDDYGGTYDYYMDSWQDANEWGADLVVHIHQDAGAGGRGFSVLYCHDMALASDIHTALLSLKKDYGVPDRGLSQRCGVAVLGNAAQPAALVECGFYTSPEDEALGPQVWARAVALGMESYIGTHLGIWPDEEEEEMIVDFERVETKEQDGPKDVYAATPVRAGSKLCLDLDMPEHDRQVIAYLKVPGRDIVHADFGVGGYRNRDKSWGAFRAVSELFGDFAGEAHMTIHVPAGSIFRGTLIL